MKPYLNTKMQARTGCPQMYIAPSLVCLDDIANEQHGDILPRLLVRRGGLKLLLLLLSARLLIRAPSCLLTHNPAKDAPLAILQRPDFRHGSLVLFSALSLLDDACLMYMSYCM